MTEEQATEEALRIDTAARCHGLSEVVRRQMQDALLARAALAARLRAVKCNPASCSQRKEEL